MFGLNQIKAWQIGEIEQGILGGSLGGDHDLRG
jgi:hypothetical protein